jgi:AcrR family transcriptional regulator
MPVDTRTDTTTVSITAQPAKRGRGRPRTFSDEDVFRAVPRAISKGGYQDLTLSLIAKEVGTTAQALIRRFGSKQTLIHRYLEWSIAQHLVRFAQVEQRHESPLEALYARAMMSPDERPDEVTDGAGYANQLAFSLEMRSDPVAAALAARRSSITELGVTRLLQAAVDRGELLPLDASEVAHLMLMAMVGTHFRHASTKKSSFQDEVRRTLDTIVKPYLPPR